MSAQHRKTAIFGWLAFVVVAFALGIVSGTTKIETATSGVGESGRIDKLLHEEFVQPAGEGVLVQSELLTVKDPAFTAAVEDVIAKSPPWTWSWTSSRRSIPRTPARSAKPGMQRSSTSRSAAIPTTPSKDRPRRRRSRRGAEGQSRRVRRLVRRQRVKGGPGRLPGRPEEGRLLSIPVTLIILIVVFGALVAAGIPLLLALTAIVATFGLVALPTSLIPIDEVTYELILLIGLAVGVDYSMFYLKREREERAAGRSEEAALEAAAATSGRSVLISGLTSSSPCPECSSPESRACRPSPSARSWWSRWPCSARSPFFRPPSPGSATGSSGPSAVRQPAPTR